jgi:hypothetical protein
MNSAKIFKLDNSSSNRTQKIYKGKTYMCPRNALGPPIFLNWAKPTWAMTAPSLPLAADIPLVTSGKCFSRDNEGSCVGTEILEEVGEAVQEYKGFGRSCRSDEVIVGETFQAVSRRQNESN